jgi:hypothetical protein
VLLRPVQGFNCIAVASLLQGPIFFPFAKLLNRVSLRGSRGYKVAYLDPISGVAALVSGTLGVFVRRRHRAFLFNCPLPNEQASDASMLSKVLAPRSGGAHVFLQVLESHSGFHPIPSSAVHNLSRRAPLPPSSLAYDRAARCFPAHYVGASCRCCAHRR